MAGPRWGDLAAARPRVDAGPFLKWAGGKGLVLPRLLPYLGTSKADSTYYEPFLGGGAVFFALQPQRAVLSDTNVALIATYRAVKDSVEEVIQRLESMPTLGFERSYYATRVRFNHLVAGRKRLGADSRVEVAALMIWLNHTCFNGLYRVNRRGEFNVPRGSYTRPSIFTRAGLRSANRALRGSRAKLETSDFESCLARAKAGDLVYLDPPYEPVSATSSFTSYTSRGFDQAEQQRLAKVVHQLVQRGVRVVLSNSPSPFIRSLYQGLESAIVRVPRAINSVGAKRAAVDELVVASGF